MKKNQGFSLVELVIVVMVSAILAAVGVPFYKDYLTKAKTAEAYSMMEIITKGQINYFTEHNEFLNIDIPNPQYVAQPLQFESNSRWELLGYPTAPGSNLFFSYRTWAGKDDASGTELTNTTDSVSGFGFTDMGEAGQSRGHYSSSGPICNSNLVSATSMGLVVQPNYSWAIVYAVGDLDGEQTTNCTALVRLLEASAASYNKPRNIGGYIMFNYGD